ncbi:hypothetical protein [Sedimentisphaera salicampi]|uniref:Sialate O-acetylesterase domain-containing protein n=1 Tax=Sedimentisphaera salicampi TaxID=1941349 RepID=A0A1W6LQA2_9BACT|nr:hypothetical protein [Sedimentisphaera salicampi]ARN57903.1 hypothetical protein STSP1_02329 [Sedimentisphaera salicampi]
MRCILILFSVILSSVMAEISLPSMFSDGMIIQADSSVPVWGQAPAYEKVEIKGSWMGMAAMTRADSEGKWKTDIKTPEASRDSLELTITTGAGEYKAIKNVLAGEVWLCCGDENMQMPVSMAMNAEAEIENADRPEIRFFTPPESISVSPKEEISGKWKAANRMNTGSFSAAAYYFADQLYDQLRIPVGIISATCASSTAEAWISKDTITSSRKMLEIVRKYPKLEEYGKKKAEFSKKFKKWLETEEGQRPSEPSYIDYTGLPSATYNSMLSPLAPYRIKGAFFFQADANLARAYQYRFVLGLLIEDWRESWDVPQLPVYVVQPQIDGYSAEKLKFVPEFWESQIDVTNKYQNTAPIVSYDVDKDNRQELGRRFSVNTLAYNYDLPDTPHKGPTFVRKRIEGSELRIFFDNVGRGLTTQTFGAVEGFEIAGIDRVYYPANAIIERNTILLSSSEVDQPVAARYGWSLTSENLPNLENRYDYPAQPFRTSRWKYITRE